MSFIFGGDTGISYDALKRQRDMAQDLQQRSMAGSQNVPEGMRAIALALMGRHAQKKADTMQQQLMAQLSPEDLERLQKARMTDIIGGL
jgi:hypothetical protein